MPPPRRRAFDSSDRRKYHTLPGGGQTNGSGYYLGMAEPAADTGANGAELGLTAAERRLAATLGGDGRALDELAASDRGGELAARHRASGALYLRARRRGLDTPAVAAWRRQTLRVAAHHLRLTATAAEVAGRLDDAGIEWTPLKGYDLATRLYDAPEERATGDLDLLIRPQRLDDARRVLRAAGWRDLYAGPRNRVFLAEEGYAWMAVKDLHPLLEIHFRLWGLVPDGFAAALFERSVPDPSLPPGGRRLSFADAYLIAAVHAWLSPRYLTAWWELARLAERLSPAQVEDLIRDASAWDLQLPVALSARISAALWHRPPCREIRRRLAGDLRAPERLLAARARHRPTALSLASLQAARLLAGRSSRMRLKGPWRRIWPHPGIVERATPEDWPWIARRLWYQIRRPWT